MATIRIYDPTAATSAEQVGAVPLPARLTGLTVGIIDNSKPNFDNLAREFGHLLQERYGVARIEYRKKRAPTVPAAAEVYDELAARCHLVFCGSGD